MPSEHSKNLTKWKEEQHPRSFQNPLNVPPATDHTIHQNTNSDHATDATESITAEENVKWNIGRRSSMDTRRSVTKKQNKNLNKNKKIHALEKTNVKIF